MLHLHSCGYNYIHREGIWIDRPSGSGNYAFVFFRSDCTVVLDNQPRAVEKHSYIMFAPSTPHAYGSSNRFVNDWLHCEGEMLPDFLARIRFPLDQPVKAAQPASIARSLMELQDGQRLGGPLQAEIAHWELQSLFAKLSNWQQHTPLSRTVDLHYQRFAAIRNELYNAPGEDHSVDSLARSANLSRSYFQHTYKALFGCSVTADMINARLEYARYLLTHTTLAVYTIAKRCGYEHETHFMRQFKKIVGLTPSAYRHTAH